LLKLGEGVRSFQIQRQLVAARAAQMRVRVIESRHHEAAFQLDDLRFGFGAAAVQQNVLDGADAENLFVAHRHRGGPVAASDRWCKSAPCR